MFGRRKPWANRERGQRLRLLQHLSADVRLILNIGGMPENGRRRDEFLLVLFLVAWRFGAQRFQQALHLGQNGGVVGGYQLLHQLQLERLDVHDVDQK